MRWLFTILLCGLFLAACARRKAPLPFGNVPPVSRPVITTTNDSLTITPGVPLFGKVSSVSEAGRFAVLTFTIGKMAAVGRTLNVYRGATKVAEIKITGPQRDMNTVGDIVAGEVKVGDEVRED